MSRATVTRTKPPAGVRLRPTSVLRYCRTCGLYDWHWAGCDEVDEEMDR